MSASRYQITHIKTSNSFRFVTDSGRTYEVYFDFKSGIFPYEDLDKHAIYMGFTCHPRQEKFERAYDEKIGETIMFIVANLFKDKKWAVVTYVCSPGDGQARQRSISFKKWYAESQLREKIELKTKRIGETYCGVLYSKKHPELETIESAIEDYDPANKYDPTEPNEGALLEEDEEDFGGTDGAGY